MKNMTDKKNHSSIKAISRQKKYLLFSGYYPTQNKTYWYIFAAISNWFLSISFLVSMTIYMYLNIQDGEKILQTIFFFLTQFSYVAKVANLVYHKKLLLQVEEILVSFDQYNKNAKIRIQNLLEDCSKISFRYTFIVYICIAAYGVGGIITKNPENQMPIPGWFPVNETEYANWIAIFQTIGLISGGHNNVLMDLLAWCMINIGSAQLLILMDSLRNIHDATSKAENKQKIILDNLKKCVDHNNKILHYISQVNKLFSKAFFIQFLSSAIVICASCIQMIVMPMNFSNLLFFIAYFGSMTYQVSMYCLYGHDVTYNSRYIGEACYMSNWYEYDIELQRAMATIMERSKRPIVLRAGKLFTLTAGTLVMILRSSYSFFAVFRRMYREQ